MKVIVTITVAEARNRTPLAKVLSRCSICGMLCCLLMQMAGTALPARGQTALPSAADTRQAPGQAHLEPGPQNAEMERRLNALTTALEQTRSTLTQSLKQIEQMRSEMDALRAAGQAAVTSSPAPAKGSCVEPMCTATEESSSSALQDTAARIDEEQEAMQAEIKQHEQTKVETVSKYPLRVSGLVLFNAFSNAGAVDDLDLPSLAFPRTPGASHGSVGASMRQTVLGLEGTGPELAGAHSSAEVVIDFFGGYSSSSYSSSSGTVRLRRATANLEWKNTSAQVGITGPLISPLSPTSYATVAEPGLSWAGNLWIWGPQAKVEQRIPLSRGALVLEAGLWDPQPTGLNSTNVLRTQSPGEQARRPAYEGRVSWRGGTLERPMQFGAGGYSSRQAYNGGTQLTSWAVTADWQLPLGRHFDLLGEAYRGSGLGSLGGGAYKDTLSGTDPVTGVARTIGLNAAGGWSQVTFHRNRSFEANAAFGLDNAYADDFYRLVLPPSTSPLQLYARNSMVVGNLIFRPRTYLILSPEYRRIISRQVYGPSYTANIFNLSFGYQF